MKKVLVVVAHPDDEVLGMGGTIAKLAAEGKEVHLLIVTDGSSAQYRESDYLNSIIDKKKTETVCAAEILGIKSIAYGELSDMRLDTIPHVDVNRVIELVIDRIQPDTVFTHFWGDVNLDHQCVYRSTLVAVRPLSEQCVRKLYCFRVPSATEWAVGASSTTFMPNVYVDISNHAAKKYEALAAYKTEVREFPHPRSVDYLKALDTAIGLQVGLGRSESFILLRKIIIA